MTILPFIIPGEPAPKGSRTAGVRRDGSIYTRPASDREKPWAATAQQALWAAAEHHGVRFRSGPVKVTACFVCDRPARPRHPYPTRGDVDKFARLLLDALVAGTVIGDDRHVTRLEVWKRFVSAGERPHTAGSVEAARPALAIAA